MVLHLTNIIHKLKQNNTYAYFIMKSSQCFGFLFKALTTPSYSWGSAPYCARISAHSAASACMKLNAKLINYMIKPKEGVKKTKKREIIKLESWIAG